MQERVKGRSRSKEDPLFTSSSQSMEVLYPNFLVCLEGPDQIQTNYLHVRLIMCAEYDE